MSQRCAHKLQCPEHLLPTLAIFFSYWIRQEHLGSGQEELEGWHTPFSLECGSPNGACFLFWIPGSNTGHNRYRLSRLEAGESSERTLLCAPPGPEKVRGICCPRIGGELHSARVNNHTWKLGWAFFKYIQISQHKYWADAPRHAVTYHCALSVQPNTALVLYPS